MHTIHKTTAFSNNLQMHQYSFSSDAYKIPENLRFNNNFKALKGKKHFYFHRNTPPRLGTRKAKNLTYVWWGLGENDIIFIKQRNRSKTGFWKKDQNVSSGS